MWITKTVCSLLVLYSPNSAYLNFSSCLYFSHDLTAVWVPRHDVHAEVLQDFATSILWVLMLRQKSPGFYKHHLESTVGLRIPDPIGSSSLCSELLSSVGAPLFRNCLSWWSYRFGCDDTDGAPKGFPHLWANNLAENTQFHHRHAFIPEQLNLSMFISLMKLLQKSV